MPRDPAGAADEPDQLADRPGLGPFLESLAAHEVSRLVEPDDPAQTGFERRHVLAKLVAVQRHADFEPECVASGKAGRGQLAATRVRERGPQGHGLAGAAEQLEPVLAGVARAREQHRNPCDRRAHARVVLQFDEPGASQGAMGGLSAAGQDRGCLRPLDRDERIIERNVADHRVRPHVRHGDRPAERR